MKRIYTVASLIDTLTGISPEKRVVILDADTGEELTKLEIRVEDDRVVVYGDYDQTREQWL